MIFLDCFYNIFVMMRSEQINPINEGKNIDTSSEVIFRDDNIRWLIREEDRESYTSSEDIEDDYIDYIDYTEDHIYEKQKEKERDKQYKKILYTPLLTTIQNDDQIDVSGYTEIDIKKLYDNILNPNSTDITSLALLFKYYTEDTKRIDCRILQHPYLIAILCPYITHNKLYILLKEPTYYMFIFLLYFDYSIFSCFCCESVETELDIIKNFIDVIKESFEKDQLIKMAYYIHELSKQVGDTLMSIVYDVVLLYFRINSYYYISDYMIENDEGHEITLFILDDDFNNRIISNLESNILTNDTFVAQKENPSLVREFQVIDM